MPNDIFRVYVNQVEVGSIPEQDYRTIVVSVADEVKADRRLYLAQVFNVIASVMRLASRFVVLMPLMFFFGVVLTVLLAPVETAQALAALQKASVGDQVAGLRTLIWVSSILTCLSMALEFVFTGYEFGYVNQFKSAKGQRLALRLRALLEVAADGEVEVHFGAGFKP